MTEVIVEQPRLHRVLLIISTWRIELDELPGGDRRDLMWYQEGMTGRGRLGVILGAWRETRCGTRRATCCDTRSLEGDSVWY